MRTVRASAPGYRGREHDPSTKTRPRGRRRGGGPVLHGAHRTRAGGPRNRRAGRHGAAGHGEARDRRLPLGRRVRLPVPPGDHLGHHGGLTITTGAPCTPTDIQAVNTWLYWSCGSSAGVYDRVTQRKITVPADLGPARLAEGFLLRENRTTHELLLTDFHTGTATTRTLVKLPATDQNTGGSNGRWAVDRFGGPIAYLTGTYGEVSIVPSGVPTSPLAQMEAQAHTPSVIGKAFPWSPVWQLNKPSTWTMTLTNASGKIVRTLTGSSTGAAVRPAWDGTTDSGSGATGGTYTWKLTAHPRDGQGPDLTLSGTMTLG
ncbi:FlgD immunoglobulin-like domain containing protein [Streptomyces collinus]|uniref:FlgD immunoglobulin-like domain containing protein n=1 Tax=Streptomyces collinus TaxID=42684 RepID=UPI0037BB8758